MRTLVRFARKLTRMSETSYYDWQPLIIVGVGILAVIGGTIFFLDPRYIQAFRNGYNPVVAAPNLLIGILVYIAMAIGFFLAMLVLCLPTGILSLVLCLNKKREFAERLGWTVSGLVIGFVTHAFLSSLMLRGPGGISGLIAYVVFFFLAVAVGGTINLVIGMPIIFVSKVMAED